MDGIATTFPNVPYQIVEERREKLVEAKREEWIQRGIYEGFLGIDDTSKNYAITMIVGRVMYV